MLNSLKKYFFFILILIVLFSFYSFDFDNYITLEFLQTNHLLIEEYIHLYPSITFILFFLIYLFFIVCFIPASLGCCIIAGFLFNPAFAIFFSTFTGTFGGLINFFTIKRTFNLRKNKQVNELAINLEKGFKQNEFLYLILLRLIPVPFAIQNAITVFFRVKVSNFVLATFTGILPWAIIYCMIGSGLHDLIENTEILNFKDLINYKLILPIVGLIFLIIVSLILKRFYLVGQK